jgi:hypothetical protein
MFASVRRTTAALRAAVVDQLAQALGHAAQLGTHVHRYQAEAGACLQ